MKNYVLNNTNDDLNGGYAGEEKGIISNYLGAIQKRTDYVFYVDPTDGKRYKRKNKSGVSDANVSTLKVIEADDIEWRPFHIITYNGTAGYLKDTDDLISYISQANTIFNGFNNWGNTDKDDDGYPLPWTGHDTTTYNSTRKYNIISSNPNIASTYYNGLAYQVITNIGIDENGRFSYSYGFSIGARYCNDVDNYGGEIFNDYINNIASGAYSHAESFSTTASGNFSHAEGSGTTASSTGSHSEGYYARASGWASHAEGSETIASGHWSHAEGSGTTASSTGSHAEGSNTEASAYYSHAEGYDTTSSGWFSHTEGESTFADGWSSHAEGGNTVAVGWYTHAEGNNTFAYGQSSHAEGSHTTAYGNYSHAEGGETTASAHYSHAEGYNTEIKTTSNSGHAEGYYSYTAANYAHAEGQCTYAWGVASHTEGYLTYATGDYSHAEGKGTKTGIYAEGAHAEGFSSLDGTIQAISKGAHAEGRTSWGKNIIAGNSTDASLGEGAHAEGWALNYDIISSNKGAHAEGFTITRSILASGEGAHAEGVDTQATTFASHAEGNNTTAEGHQSHAEGNGTTAYVLSSHAEGNASFTKGVCSHAEGNTTSTWAASSHAEGTLTVAYGESSHVGGVFSTTTADAARSIAHGLHTIASSENEAVFGQYNGYTDEDNLRHTYTGKIFEIGIGSADTARQNAMDISTDGTTYLYGNVYIAGTLSSNNVIDITYANLVALITAGTLIEGQKYCITDYQTMTSQANTSSDNTAFPLVVTALNSNTLDCMATSPSYPKCNIWYDINNDTTKYAWADTVSGKGVIYRMYDSEDDNEAPYDFKHISVVIDNITYQPIIGKHNRILKLNTNIPRIYVNGDYNTLSINYPIATATLKVVGSNNELLRCGGANNVVTGACNSVVLSSGINITGNYNIILPSCYSIVISGHSNYIQHNCENVNITNGNNYIGNGSERVNITGFYNTIMQQCKYITITGNTNTISNSGYAIIITGDYNSFGNCCANISFSGSAYKNLFGNYCNELRLNECNVSIFENGVNNIRTTAKIYSTKFEVSCTQLVLTTDGDYSIHNCIFHIGLINKNITVPNAGGNTIEFYPESRQTFYI